MVRTTLGPWLAVMLAMQAGAALASEDEAVEIATLFCGARLAYDEQATRVLLTPELLEAIAVAEARDGKIAAANPDEKPPLGDGIPYQSYTDLASTCTAGAAGMENGILTIEVAYSFDDDPDAGWTDRLALVTGAEGKLLVDDVLFFRRSEEEEQYGLRRTMTEIFSHWAEAEAD
jgi:hypothetical protein